MVAYQMARLLHQAGDEVGLLALFDTYNPAVAGHASRMGILWQRAKFHVGNLLKLRPRELKAYFKEKIRVAKYGELSNLLQGEKALPAKEDDRGNFSGTTNSVTRLQQINDKATENYCPKPYDGQLVIFKPHVNYNFLSDPQMGWSGLVSGELNVVELPVNPHAMLVSPFVNHLGAVLRQKLDQIGTQPLTAVSH
jgi:aspartate racemase